MKKIKQNKAITLVALIITIIILLLLAGITIGQLTNNGLFENAKTAKDKYENEDQKETELLGEYENAIITGEVITSDRGTVTEETLKLQHTMSDEEHFTGDYYFNGKPIYAKTIYISELPNKSSESYNHGIEDFDVIWFDTSKCFGIRNDTEGGYTLPFASEKNVEGNIRLGGIGDTEFEIRAGADRSDISAYITFNYTKTTDTGNGKTITATPAN